MSNRLVGCFFLKLTSGLLAGALQFGEGHGEVWPANWKQGASGMTASPEGALPDPACRPPARRAGSTKKPA
ncbi:hypothetical protein KDW96_18355 [Pseudomonas benzenivorans]|uniref:Peroxiredoxin C-terminal domain-containing protein n=1 Tax=Pseudomonas benzenivorans TaxID=556533 RepID=A0ABY5H5N4_9PSED|nr:hypothetical protein KDW96_18355 [Pseudomonas benzenivorans]